MSCGPDSLRYRLTQEFNRIEAVNTQRIDPADPLWLHVRVTPADDLYTEIESALLPNVNPNGVVVTELAKHPYRLFTGTWAYDITSGLYEAGKQYTVHWRFAMQPNVLNVVRNNFIWQPIPFQAHEPDGCIVHGVISRNRVPIGGARLIIERYRNFATLHQRISSIDVTTDAFGYWWAELQQGTVQRFVLNDMSYTKRVPAEPCASFDQLPDWQVDDVPKDSFGYPLPGTDADGLSSNDGSTTTPTGTGTYLPNPTMDSLGVCRNGGLEPRSLRRV